MSFRRLSPFLVGSVLIVALVTGASGPALSAPSVNKHGVVGHLAYVSKTDKVIVVAAKGYGTTSAGVRIGPVTTAPPAHKIKITDFQSSADGDYIAWEESVVKRNGDPTGTTPTLVLREISPSNVWTLRSAAEPIGFGGADQLVVTDGQTSVFVPTPTPHLTAVPNADDALAVYPGGVVRVNFSDSPPGPKITEQVQLVSFDGTTKTVHNYVMSGSNPRLPEQAFVSPDGKWLLVERGDHTDFGGIGPSSLIDEYRIQGSQALRLLGHFGTAKAAWRVGDVSWAWQDDEPWVVFQRAVKHGAKTAIAVFQHGKWRKVISHGIAVAATSDGFVVAAPGKYVFDSNGIGVTKVPTGDALLIYQSVARVLGVEGSAFAWVDNPNK